MSESLRYDVVVAGAGPAGLACALALALDETLSIAAVAPAARGKDARTAALFPGSVALLRNLGAWEPCRAVAEPLRAIRIVDAIGAPLAAPEVVFRSDEAGLDAFAYNVPNEVLTRALREAAADRPSNLSLIDGTIAALSLDDGHGARIHLAGDRVLAARLVVGADGRNSVCRTAAGIATRTWGYGQSAIACAFAHGRPHGGISTEFHTTAGPLTTVPMPGLTSSLVWVERPVEAARLASLGEGDFRAALENKLQGLLGAIGAIGPRGAFPLSGLAAAKMGARRVALVGEAGHVLPPIGAQGLNLGFRDGAALADTVADARKDGRDIGGPEALTLYSAARAGDIETRTFAVGFLNRALLLSNMPPVNLARGLGLVALAGIGPLRRRLMREGLEPRGTAPRLMRETVTA